ncbi:MAG TPA: xanthine dehydrogenase family protein subunit M [Candidatus Acidoferrales bacterium]|nr:xanthine dehydrogenase family protein subunit M [Candidatus Acidoferrales bacterium]
MYPRAFHYHRARSLGQASSLLVELGEEAKVLAGGQSLIPLMKLRLASPGHLVDLNFVPGLSYVKQEGSEIRCGALTRHAEIESSPVAQQIPILHDCASGIADVQVRNRGTLVGSLAEADPSGDWAPVLLTLSAAVRCVGPKGERTIPLSKFIEDAYTTALGPAELVSEVVFPTPPKNSGGAYLAFKRCAPVYATASVAVHLTVEDKDICTDAQIVLGAVGLTAIRATEAEAGLRGRACTKKSIEAAREAARAAAEPQSDRRGSQEYKRALVGVLVERAIGIALERSRGKRVEASHLYV